MIRRGGLHSKPKLSENQAAEQMEAIRKTQAAKMQDMVSEGKKLKKVGDAAAVDTASEAKVGQVLEEPKGMGNGAVDQEAPPLEFTQFCPTDQEAAMMDLIEGPDAAFFEDYDEGKPVREVGLDEGDPDPVVRDRLQKMMEVDRAGLTEGYGEQLQTFLKN